MVSQVKFIFNFTLHLLHEDNTSIKKFLSYEHLDLTEHIFKYGRTL